jgi:hypothetical protein
MEYLVFNGKIKNGHIKNKYMYIVGTIFETNDSCDTLYKLTLSIDLESKCNILMPWLFVSAIYTLLLPTTHRPPGSCN